MSINKQTEDYIRSRPSIKDCLKEGLINYSSLTRKISKEKGIKKFDAVLIACRRYKRKLSVEKSREKKIVDILKGSRLEVKNKIAVIVIEKPRYFDDLIELQKKIKKQRSEFHLIEGQDVVNIITNEEFIPMIEEVFKNKIVNINKDLVEIILVADRRIETTSGVIAYVYSLLGDNGVNIVEEMSCWTDVLMVINENDLAKTMELLKF
jgi:hypothetical protein